MWDDAGGAQPGPIEKRRIRLDTVSTGSVAPRAEGRSFLKLFRLWGEGGVPESERRRSARHAVVEAQVWLGWKRPEAGFRTHPAILINLSRGGAYVFLDERPPRDQAVWICLGMPQPINYVEGRVVAIRTLKLGQCAAPARVPRALPLRFLRGRRLRTGPLRPQATRPTSGDGHRRPSAPSVLVYESHPNTNAHRWRS